MHLSDPELEDLKKCPGEAASAFIHSHSACSQSGLSRHLHCDLMVGKLIVYAPYNTLALSAGYVAGFVDPEVSNRLDLFDVYVNLPDGVITVSQSAKGTV